MNQTPDPPTSPDPADFPRPDCPESLSWEDVQRRNRRLVDDLRQEWTSRATPLAEEQASAATADGRTVASLLFEEYCRQGPPVEVEEDTGPPTIGVLPVSSLVAPFEPSGSLASTSVVTSRRLASLPAVGEEVLGFRLKAELGRGAFARVFLAEQAGLADRPVVVKISAIQGNEPQTLAQLQHTHIVPIYSLHDSPQIGLRLVCMPYFGGASLAQILDAGGRQQRHERKGASLVQSLQSLCRSLGMRGGGSKGTRELGLPDDVYPPFSLPAPDTTIHFPAGTCPEGNESPLQLLNRLSFIEAAAWIIARLAEALQHAHQRGILHRDIKPSNILLTREGQPMLLDFNLAQPTADAEEAATSVLGGTVAYMAPEHLRALASKDPVLARQVDHRADLYSLGMVFFEMLAGQSPFAQSGSYSAFPALINAMALERAHAAPSIRRLRNDIPWSLESIVRKCLAPAPAQRYQHAEHLAEDLRRSLTHRPLRHAPELSFRERLQKWMRRHPRLTSTGAVGTMAVALLLALGFTLFFVHAQLVSAEVAQKQRQFELGLASAHCLINTQTARLDRDASLTLSEHSEQGVRGCEETLAIYGVLTEPAWQRNPAWQGLAPENRQRLAGDVREMLLVLADARVHLARQTYRQVPPSVLQEALAVLRKAEEIPDLDPCAALYEQRAAYLDDLARHYGQALAAEVEEARAQARGLPATTARDHYLLALTFISRNRLDQAVSELKRATRLDPKHYWAWFRLGLCYTELKEYKDAAGAYDACTALWPEFAWAYLNRGGAYAHLGRVREALEDYDLALRYNPSLAFGYLNRGLAQQQQGQHAQALQDFDQALALGAEDAALHAGRGASLEALGRHAEADQAFQSAFRCQPADVSLWLMRGFALARRLPDQSCADFERALDLEPECVEAWYGQGMVLADPLGDTHKAMLCFEQALQVQPAFVPALRGRSILAARCGQFALACADVENCLKLEPSGINYYNAACVYALRARDEPAAGEVAIRYLREAFRLGYGRDRHEADVDLEPVRTHPAYQQLAEEWSSPAAKPRRPEGRPGRV